MRQRRCIALIVIAILAAVTAGVAASPAFADPPVGTPYCMDGNQTFTIWDAASAHVTNKVVTQKGGLFTAGEVDPANIGRPAVQQYYDAIETSDAIGNYGVDTTIPNYVVHHISPDACPVAPENHVFLCYSRFEVDPGVWPVSQAQALLESGYWEPSAVSGTVGGGTNIGSFHLVCNPPTSSVSDGLYIGGDGSMIPGADAGAAGFYPHVG
jgi:hypothetical protein